MQGEWKRVSPVCVQGRNVKARLEMPDVGTVQYLINKLVVSQMILSMFKHLAFPDLDIPTQCVRSVQRCLQRHSCITRPVTINDSPSMLESLPSYLLEEICKHLSDPDLCRLAKVNKYCQFIFSSDEFWELRAAEKEIAKAVEEQSLKWNVMASQSKFLLVRPLENNPVFFKGAVTIIDPFKVFFKSFCSADQLKRLWDIVKTFNNQSTNFILTYRGIQSVFVTAAQWDSDTAFEVTRDGNEMGCDEANSKCIAVIPKELIDLLLKENGEEKLDGGVTVEGVDGKVLCGRDGDFIISRPTPSPHSRNILKWIEDEWNENVDILCAAGGSWTFIDESSSEEDDDTCRDIPEEELRRVLAEEEREEEYDDRDFWI